jgi:hypothetical protein
MLILQELNIYTFRHPAVVLHMEQYKEVEMWYMEYRLDLISSVIS